MSGIGNRWPIVAILAGLLWSPSLHAQPEGPACGDEGESLSPTRYLRALSIDLRGALPSLAEYEAVEAAGEVTPAEIEAMLASEAFGWQFVEFHRKLLWPYLGPTRPLSPVELYPDAGVGDRAHALVSSGQLRHHPFAGGALCQMPRRARTGSG